MHKGTTIIIPDDHENVESQEARIKKLEKEVERMRIMHTIHAVIVVLAFMGLTAGIVAKFSSLKKHYIK